MTKKELKQRESEWGAIAKALHSTPAKILSLEGLLGKITRNPLFAAPYALHATSDVNAEEL